MMRVTEHANREIDGMIRKRKGLDSFKYNRPVHLIANEIYRTVVSCTDCMVRFEEISKTKKIEKLHLIVNTNLRYLDRTQRSTGQRNLPFQHYQIRRD